MEQPVRDIPGYYYDKEKRKYFKIQPSHTAPPSSAYSAQDVKRRKTRDEKEATKAVMLKRQHGRIKWSKVFQEPLMGGVLSREYGNPGLDTGRVFASGLVHEGHFHIDALQYYSSDSIFDVQPRPDIGPYISDVRIAADCQLVSVRISTELNQQHDKVTEQDGIMNIVEKLQSNRVKVLRMRIERGGSMGPSTSLSVNEPSGCLAMTWLAGNANAGVMVNDLLLDESLTRTIAPNVISGPGTVRSRETSIYGSTSAPPSSSLLFAIGSSHGILSIDKERTNMRWLTADPALMDDPMVPTDINALEFLTETHSILLSGGRHGILHITDLRIPQHAGACIDVITHPSSINHIKQLDAHRILVAGLSSSLCQYDLRFRKDQPRILPKISKEPEKNLRLCNYTSWNQHTTRPILTYPEFFNPSQFRLGLDVDLETGIIAAAQQQIPYAEDPQPLVKLFSLHGGYVLDSNEVGTSHLSNKCKELGYGVVPVGDAKCVKFARDVEGKMKSLYVGEDAAIKRYAWAEKDDEEEK